MNQWNNRQFFKNISTIDNPLIAITKKSQSEKERGHELPISKMGVGITTDATNIKRIIEEDYIQLYANNLTT